MEIEREGALDASLPSYRYRDHSKSGIRKQRGMLRYSDLEWAAIVVAASEAGWSPQAWAQQVAFATAVRRQQVLDVGALGGAELLESLRDARHLLANIGGNVNDIAKAANANGDLPSETTLTATLETLRTYVQKLDTCVAMLRRG